MKFDELVEKVRKIAQSKDVSDKDFLAVQVDITGKYSGVFWVEIKDHKVSMMPNEFYDCFGRDCAVAANLTNFNKLLNGRLDPVQAIENGKLKVDGDEEKALEFFRLLRK